MTTGVKTADSANARRSTRKALRTLGEILVDGRDPPMECMVLDMSGSGARLKLGGGRRNAFAPAIAMPETFRLAIPRDNTVIDCRVAWREKDMVGITFTSSFRPIKVGRRV